MSNIESMVKYRKSTQEEKQSVFLKNAKIVHGNKYDYSKSFYINDKTKLIIICHEHGEFLQNYNSHVISKQGCPKCYLKNGTSENRRRNEKGKQDFFKKMKDIYNDYYNLSKFEYVNSNTKGIVICPKHGEFLKEPNKLINRLQACPHCSREKLISNGERIIEDFFTNRNITYSRNKDNIFEGCISNKGNYLDFDFYIEDLNLLIEFDGEQHFKPKFNNDIDEFNRVRECDIIRNKWSLEHDISFIRLSYKLTINQINEILTQIIDGNLDINNKNVYISSNGNLYGNSEKYYLL